MSTPAPAPASTYSIKNPFPARHIDNYVLTGAASEKETRHHSISLDGSGLNYLPGDALGLVATNCPRLADELVRALKDTVRYYKDGPVPRTTRIETQLFQESSHANARALVADTDADGAIFVVNAHNDHSMFEPRVADAGHRQQQFARKEARAVHAATMRLGLNGCKTDAAL